MSGRKKQSVAELNEALRRVAEARKALEAVDTVLLADELARRLHGGEAAIDDADLRALVRAISPTKELASVWARDAGLVPEDVWPGEYMSKEDLVRTIEPLLRLCARLVHDFDMSAFRELAHLLRRMDVNGRFDKQAAEALPGLLLGSKSYI